jgi:hypothetical protein
MLERLISPLKEFGWLAGLAYLVDRALNSISTRFRLHVCEIMVQPVTDKPLLTPALAKQLELRELKRGDPEVALMPVGPEIKEFRFAQNAICLGVFKREVFIGYVWFCFGRYDEDLVRCTFELSPPAQSVFDFDLFLFPEHRMGLGFAGTWHSANAYLRSRGIEYSFSRVNRFNLPSRRAHKHLGSKPVGRALFLQLGTVELMAGTIYPFVHLSLVPANRVCLRIGPDALRCR